MITAESYTAPIFYNAKVQEINTSLDSLGWIQYIFPIARDGVDENGTYPEVYKNDGSRVNIRVLPEDNSFSFWSINGAITEHPDDEGLWFIVPLSLYVWGDLTKIDTDKEYNYTVELIRDVVSILDDHSCNNLEILIDDVFGDYSYLESIHKQITMLPYTAFRINCEVSLPICYTIPETVIVTPDDPETDPLSQPFDLNDIFDLDQPFHLTDD